MIMKRADLIWDLEHIIQDLKNKNLKNEKIYWKYTTRT